MNSSEAINIAAEHLWLHHRAIIEEHTDYILRLYRMYKTVERVYSRHSTNDTSIANISHMRRMLFFRRVDLEKTIDVKYR